MKKLLMYFFTSVIISLTFSIAVSASENKCGENLKWSLDDNGTFTISGNGEMFDYDTWEEKAPAPPWSDKHALIKRVVIEEGITRIGNEAFRGCENLTDVTFSNSLIEIGNGAFMFTNLSKVIIPDTVKKIDWNCFAYCFNLNEIYIGKNVEYIGDHSFAGNKSLTSINIPESVAYIGGTAFTESNLNTIYYEGSKEQWDNIDKSTVWDFGIINGENLIINYKENGKVTDYASYNPNSINISIDGNYIKFDVQPQIINGRTLVPMRKIFEELGATVDWDDSTQTAIGTKENTVVKFTINDYTMYKNESANTLDVPAQLIDGRTLIPLRAVSEAFDCQVGWDGNDSIVSIIDDSEKYTMLYAPNDRSKSFASNTVSQQLTVGWYTEPVQILYAPGKSAVFKKSEVESQLIVGWYTEPVCTMYAPDGNTIIVLVSEKMDYINNGWYTEPIVNPIISSCYPGTNVPTYTNVTGVPLKDTLVDENGTIYRYDYTLVGEYNEFSDYIVYLIKNHWTEAGKTENDEMLIYWFSKNGTRVMVGYVAKVDEIWISIP